MSPKYVIVAWQNLCIFQCDWKLRMPAPDTILDGLTAIANQWQSLAIGWHLYFAAFMIAFAAGWHPSSRLTAAVLTVPVFSVSEVAWQAGNEFNGGVFMALGVLLMAIAIRLPGVRVHLAPRPFLIPGVMLVAFGWAYPHFLQTDSWLTYTYAAPLGLIPCPTLSVLIGVTLMLDLFGSRSWSRALIAAGLFYGVFGVLRLGVALDWVLIAGTLALTAADAHRDRILHRYRLPRAA